MHKMIEDSRQIVRETRLMVHHLDGKVTILYRQISELFEDAYRDQKVEVTG